MDRLTILLTLVFLLAANVTSAQLTTSGVLTEDTTWSGTVDVLGDVTVPEGLTLTIDPGTVIRFAARSDKGSSGANTVLTEFTVSGVLIAKGTADKMITFTSELTENPVPGDWMGIKFSNHSFENHTIDSIIDYCIIEYAENGINCGGGNYQPAPNIMNSIIRKNKNHGLYLGSYNSIIEGNTVMDNGKSGIYVGSSTKPIIDKNRITGNKDGLSIHGSASEARITNNLVTDNEYCGVCISVAQPSLGNVGNVDTTDDGGNHIYGNGRHDLYNASPTLIKAEGNYWGTNNPAVIDSHIWDNEEGVATDFNGNTVMPGIVDFEPWLSSPGGSLTYFNTVLEYYTRSGVITKDETWSGIVKVLGDVIVPEDITLNIEPGTTVRFSARSDSESGGVIQHRLSS